MVSICLIATIRFRGEYSFPRKWPVWAWRDEDGWHPYIASHTAALEKLFNDLGCPEARLVCTLRCSLKPHYTADVSLPVQFISPSSPCLHQKYLQLLQPGQISKILQQSVPGIIKMRGMNGSLHLMAALGRVIMRHSCTWMTLLTPQLTRVIMKKCLKKFWAHNHCRPIFLLWYFAAFIWYYLSPFIDRTTRWITGDHHDRPNLSTRLVYDGECRFCR